MGDLASKLVLGTAGLGMAYGRLQADGAVPTAPDSGRAEATCQAAWEIGVRVADTAPAYGVSEKVLGRYWPGAIWTT